MTMERMRIGQIFVKNGTISEITLQRALERAERKNRKLGYTLVDMGVVTVEELTEALALQFVYKIVHNIRSHIFPKNVLEIISADIAMRYLLFPLKREGNELYLAMADPTDTRIISNIAENNGVTIVPVIASRADIIGAINKYYHGRDSHAERDRTVLIAEDSSLACADIEQILASSGYKVLIAKDGIEAFKMAIQESPCVIITDKEMPNFNGYRLLESLQSLHETKNIPVILLTSSSSSLDEEDAFKKGFFDFMAKPVNDVTLVTRVGRAFRAFEDQRRMH
jgi:CheY-like chemotaxis protein